jgi:hypothetical protein
MSEFIEVFGKKMFKSVFDVNMLKENIQKFIKVLETVELDDQTRRVFERDLRMDQEILKKIEESDK